jgi:NAD(P)-dependent dehydrogenase (short-subunit alcohol dehydrogenase family)/rhamnose utilization protein RhaD (predicted bifunctional aldolase and dehydrogenase)
MHNNMQEEFKRIQEFCRDYLCTHYRLNTADASISFKNDNEIRINALGVKINELGEAAFLSFYRDQLQQVNSKSYIEVDENEVDLRFAKDMIGCMYDPTSDFLPPSGVFMHNLMEFKYVLQILPDQLGGLLCSRNARKLTGELFGDQVLWINYYNPGRSLSLRVKEELDKHHEQHQQAPEVLFIQNNCVLIGGDTMHQLKDKLEGLMDKVQQQIDKEIDLASSETPGNIEEILPAIRMLLSGDKIKIIRFRNHKLFKGFYDEYNHFTKIAHPLTPFMQEYCEAKYIYIQSVTNPQSILNDLKNQLERFKKEFDYLPRIIVIKDYGVIAIGESWQKATDVLNVFEKLAAVSFYADNFGGPSFLNPDQTRFLHQSGATAIKSELGASMPISNPVNGKVIIVTGAAQGFGKGIAQELFGQGANVIVADMNEDAGKSFVNELNEKNCVNRALFVPVNVAHEESVLNMVQDTVSEFGGVDVCISNAGVLRAGGLDEMDGKTFDFMTDVNYKGYFFCAKYISKVMKLQHEYNPGHFMDIIQINSKSGLKGSNKNFAYAGAKFGGIGLTQSFALELVGYNIKVNSICPGNFFDGPLWADPEKGLFVQYLKAGKVPGARSIEEVKAHYEKQVPLNRGCLVKDVVKAVVYVIDQQYETGQALPVTGGQIMMS